jgi:uncharacterized membrane protein
MPPWHLYRGGDRAVAAAAIDGTTNWAVITASGHCSLGNATGIMAHHPQYAVESLFLFIEARRYRL